jgi:hypothetical protein
MHFQKLKFKFLVRVKILDPCLGCPSVHHYLMISLIFGCDIHIFSNLKRSFVGGGSSFNRWLQWLQNVQKPLAGLFRHLVWPKIEEDRLPGSSPSNLLSLDRQNAPLAPQPSPHVHICVKTQHRVQPHKWCEL